MAINSKSQRRLVLQMAAFYLVIDVIIGVVVRVGFHLALPTVIDAVLVAVVLQLLILFFAIRRTRTTG
ncbi:MAG: hypothetical protein ACP5PJ_03910 [Acidimicrobiales bacterium]